MSCNETLKELLTPLFNRIVVKRYVKEETRSGIIIPELAQEGSQKANQGEIIAVGPSANIYVENYEDVKLSEDQTNFLKPGDKVLFGKYAGVEMVVEGEKIMLMNNVDVISKISRFIDT